MIFHSTKNSNLSADFTTAIQQGLAPDGGLYVPASFPTIKITDYKDYPDFARQFLQVFVKGSVLEEYLDTITQQAFNFDVPLKKLSEKLSILELFHGPTLSFKDIGARFLASCMNVLAKEQQKTVLVATSGDTGSAVASAFSEQKNMRAVILFPEGKISKRQQQQITCWDKNILAIAIQGTFDDCQNIVKTAFADSTWSKFNLTTSNSINIGRLLPQAVYYAYTATEIYKNTGQAMNVIVPSGNLGNVTAAFWAKAVGFPIENIVIACNANKTMLDYYETGKYKPRISIETLANAMDVGRPSNFERIQHLFKTHQEFKSVTEVYSVSDKEISDTIKDTFDKYHEVLCPHTATAVCVSKQRQSSPWVIVATAHPAKFETIIEPLINEKIPVPSSLEKLLKREAHYETSSAELADVQRICENNFMLQ